MLPQPLRIIRYAAANAFADLRYIYTWQSWTFGWLARMLAQVIFFTLIGELIDRPGQTQFLVVGNALMTCVVEAMMVVASSTWERASGTLPLLIAAPARLTWVFVGRSVQWLISGSATSLVALLALGPLFGVHWSAGQIPPVILLVVLTSVTTYCFGLFLAALVLSVSGARNIVSNSAYLVMMAICGVQVPVTFWPEWVRVLAATLPLTHALRGLRQLLANAPADDVAMSGALAAGAGACWLGAAYLAFAVFGRRGVRAGTIDFAE